MGTGLENASSQLQEDWNRIISKVLKAWYSSTGFAISFSNRAVTTPLKFWSSKGYLSINDKESTGVSQVYSSSIYSITINAGKK